MKRNLASFTLSYYTFASQLVRTSFHISHDGALGGLQRVSCGKPGVARTRLRRLPPAPPNRRDRLRLLLLRRPPRRRGLARRPRRPPRSVARPVRLGAAGRPRPHERAPSAACARLATARRPGPCAALGSWPTAAAGSRPLARPSCASRVRRARLADPLVPLPPRTLPAPLPSFLYTRVSSFSLLTQD